jgi:hypothetical protein
VPRECGDEQGRNDGASTRVLKRSRNVPSDPIERRGICEQAGRHVPKTDAPLRSAAVFARSPAALGKI